MMTTEKCAGYIQLTFRDDANNGFVTLGGIGLLTQAEVKAYWADVPKFEGESAFIADLMDVEQDIVDDRVISAETCERYLGKSIDVLIAEGREKTCFTLAEVPKKRPDLVPRFPALFPG